MILLRINIEGRVAYNSATNITEGFLYDVVFDYLGIPIIPIEKLLDEQGVDLEGITMGLAHPDSYYDYMESAYEILKTYPEARSIIMGQFTEDLLLKETNDHIRCITPGGSYIARVGGDADAIERFSEQIEKIKQIGYTSKEISGEVSLSVIEYTNQVSQIKLNPDMQYASLRYTLMFVTPACVYAPYGEDAQTLNYIPGGLITELFSCKETTICSNAYISDGSRRKLPVPLCSALVKYHKNIQHYRLAEGKDPTKAEQELTFHDVYTDDIESRLLQYETPETRKITTEGANVCDMIAPGQMFSGIIYGSDEEIRFCAEQILENPIQCIGLETDKGFGEAVFVLENVKEDPIPAEMPERCFDVLCVSDTILIGECLTPSFKDELEYILNAPGKLRIRERYTEQKEDFDTDYLTGQMRSVTRCLAKGSIFRIETTDGSYIDIAPIMHTFIGEHNRDGYGEILCFKARGEFYRKAQEVPTKRYTLQAPLYARMMDLQATISQQIAQRVLEAKASRIIKDDMNSDAPETEETTEGKPSLDRYLLYTGVGQLGKWYTDDKGKTDDE